MKIFSQYSWKNSQYPGEKQPSRFFLALLLTGVLGLEVYPGVVQVAHADPSDRILPPPQLDGKGELGHFVSFERSRINPSLNPSLTMLNLINIDAHLVQNELGRDRQLPPQVAIAVRQDLSKQTNIPLEKLKITEFSSESWPNTCLGLPKPDELCGQMIVEGWRVVLSDGSQNWVYRSDRTGKVLRRENKEEGRRKKEEGRRKKEEGRRKKEEGRRKKEEGRRKKEEGRRKKEEGRRKKEEGRRKKNYVNVTK
ncbi:hypothetical protein BCD67_17580 [Oscillatoriales cyanobacterium USR001]|nr:hypothetical protein BCD67_17580 [Oscillatoriales cyanobacterium USR001]